jgi:hypothetical protein
MHKFFLVMHKFVLVIQKFSLVMQKKILGRAKYLAHFTVFIFIV